MRIGYFGGSFDPPHRGHLAVAVAARDHFALDRVLLAPTARQPLKPHGPEAPFADRLRMTELLCQSAAPPGHPAPPNSPLHGLEASAIDGPQPGNAPNYTVDTLRRLRAQLAAEHPNQPLELFAILGADAFALLPKWREPDELLRLAQWIIVSRPGHPLPLPASLTPAQRTRIHPLDGPADPTSATSLRQRLHAGHPAPEELPEAVQRYILAAHLYA